ncbi:MAG TPA: double-strand break repair helicase AddA, partial [Rhizomicrobium sp.]|nr:double-strand break repair helicase AddA [Rhizomicrobium sp.]
YLLTRFPLEAGVAPGFRVLDDQTARELAREARGRVLEQAGSHAGPLGEAVARLVTQTSEGRLQQVFDAVLGSDRRKLERFFTSLDGDLAGAARRAHGAGDGDTVESIASEFRAGISGGEIRAVIDWLSGGGKTDVKYADLLAEFLACDAAPDAFAILREIFLKTDGEARDKLASKKLEDANPALFARLVSVGADYVDADERMRAATAASLAEAALILADAVRKIFAEEKRLRGVLDYDDLIASTLALLERGDAAAWVLYKLDGGLDHILIDEAQDTSPEQWEIVRALTGEFFSGEGARDASRKPRTIFAVGDEKQSIFSFQGADPVQFDINRRHFESFAKNGGGEFVGVELATSRRSAPEILAFVDEVFADESAREGLTSAGAAVAHKAHRETAKGRVEFWPAIKPAERAERDWWRPVDVASQSSPVRLLAQRIAANIKNWTDGKTRLPGHDAPIRPGDIMILMPRREPFASEIIRQLKERGVPVAGADRIKLPEQIAVMDLIALGRFALLAEDDLNLAALLRSPLIGMSEEELFSLCVGRKGSLWRELVARREEFALAYEFLSEMLARADFTAPHEFYAHALAARGMKKRLLQRLGPEAEDSIDEFLSLALSYEALNSPSLEGFLHWIERGEAEIKRDMERGRDEVRVMTVHGAKGLEADIVILPDTTTLPDAPGKRGALLHTENGVVFPASEAKAPRAVTAAKAAAEAEAMRERRRLLYVALTRAKDRLYICGFENKKGVSEGSWYELTERAAQSLGVPVRHGEETRHVIGEADLEKFDQPVLPFAGRTALPDWAHTPPKSERAATRIIRPSDALDEPSVFSPLGAKGEARFRRGLLVHDMLARLPDIPPTERRERALAFLQSRKVEASEAESLADHTLAVIDHPDFAQAFAPGSHAEAPVFADLPELGRIIGRIDRLAVTDGRVLAVDFKTNRPPPAGIEEVPKIYVAQMALYRAALAKIFPGRRIAAALVWTEGPNLMELPEALLEAEIGRIRARLDHDEGRS